MTVRECRWRGTPKLLGNSRRGRSGTLHTTHYSGTSFGVSLLVLNIICLGNANKLQHSVVITGPKLEKKEDQDGINPEWTLELRRRPKLRQKVDSKRKIENRNRNMIVINKALST
ncbi:hypothetical protein EVAR_99122_1 [Eumeta japonica]|uniref:Uncharacterized protein n=1 Tax=Eumeta variegata TaxID=151549 RepID=A0A4C1YRE7_EUMVA|nr:hypothetical protein EVAR_99122_1 [Eumeta japonica]